jgi:uncharacterized protein YecT (DUF1311 family)
MPHLSFNVLLIGLATLAPALSLQPGAQPVVANADGTNGASSRLVAESHGADLRRAAAFAAMAQGWDRPTRAAFERLLVAQAAFARAVGDNETDHTAPNPHADAMAATQAEKDAFVRSLQRSTDPHPSVSAAAYRHEDTAAFDAALRTTYDRVIAVLDPVGLGWGSVTPAGIAKTQKLWLAYRDAFVGFVGLRGADAAAVDADITSRRLTNLEGLLED